MSNTEIIGDKNGIALWNLMATSSDNDEREYFKKLNTAASKYGEVWFTDLITQKASKKNQTTWYLKWNGTQWFASQFCVPEGVDKVSARIKNSMQKKEVIELNVNDLLTE